MGGNTPDLSLGKHEMKRTPILLSAEDRARHMHVIGRTGSGKSKLLEWMIREDIKAGRGLLLLDPHGDLYRGVLGWAIDQRLDSRLVLIDQNQLDWAVGLNYLWEPGMTPDWIAGRAQEGIAKVFGDERQEAMPIVRNWLPPVLKALILANLRLSEGRLFIDDPDFRRAVLERVRDRDPDLKEIWQAYEGDKRTQEIAMMAVRNRLMPFSTEEMRPVVGQDRNTVNWEDVLEQGKVVLANLAPEAVSPQSQQMLGVMILHQVVSAAKRRPERKRRRFYIYCDEFQNYVTEEFARALEEMRKFQVSFVLAHQHLAQIERSGEWILQSVISQPGIRVVFHPGNRADAEVLAKELFTGTPEISSRRVKNEIVLKKFKPEIVWEGVESTTEGVTSGGSDSWDGEDFTSTTSDSSTQSTTRSTIPVTHHEEFKEVTSRTYHSLDEEWEKATAWIMQRPDRHAFFHLRGNRPMRMVTPDVEEPNATSRFIAFRSSKALARSGKPRSEVEQEIQQRKASLAIKSAPTPRIPGKKPEITPHPHLEEQE